MKKYIMATAIISLFVSAQIVSMDRKPSTESSLIFQNFLTSKLTSERNSYLGAEQFPEFHSNVLAQWKNRILDMLQKHRIDRSTARAMFFNMVSNVIIQEVMSRNPDYDRAEVLNLFRISYLPDITVVTEMIFD